MANDIRVGITADSSQLFAELNKATAGIKNAAENMSGSFSGVGATLNALKGPIVALTSIFAGGSLFGSGISDTITFQKEVNKLSSVFGISKIQATTLSIAIGDIYGDADTFTAGASKFTKVLKENEDRITQLTGVRTRDNGQLRNGQTVMLEVLQGLDKYKSGLDKNLVAQELFGRSFVEMIKYQKLTTSVMLEAEKKVNDLGLAFGVVGEQKVAAYRASVNDLDDAFLAMKKNVSVELMPSLTSLGTILANVITPMTKGLVSLLNGLMSILSMTTVQVVLFGTAIYGAGKALIGLGIAKTFIENFKVFNAVLKLEGATAGIAGMRAFGAAMYSALGPLGIAIGVITALALAFEYLAKSEERAAKASKQVTDNQIDRAEAIKNIADDMKDKAAIFENKNLDAATKEQAKSILESNIKLFNSKYQQQIDFNAFIKLSYKEQLEFANIFGRKGIENLSNDIKIREELIKKDKDTRQATLGIETFITDQDGKEISLGKVTQNEIDIAHTNATKNLRIEIEALTKSKSALLIVEDKKTNTKSFDMAKADYELEKLKIQALKDRKEEELKNGNTEYNPTNFELPLEAEKTFWSSKLNIVTKGGAEELAVLKKIDEIRKKEAAKLQKDEEEALARKLEATQDLKEKERLLASNSRKIALREGIEAEYSKKAQNATEKESILLLRDRNQAIELEVVADKEAEVAILSNKQNDIKLLEEQGLISKKEAFDKWKELELEKYILLKQIKYRELDTAEQTFGLGSSQVAKIKIEYDKLIALEGILVSSKNPENAPDHPLLSALKKLKAEALPIAKELETAYKNVFKGLESSMASAFNGLLLGQIKAGMVLQTIWKGLGTTIAGELSKIMASKIAGWMIDKTISAWNSINTKKEVTEAGIKGTAKTGEGAAGLWASFSTMGPVGVALAIAAVALMIASISAAGGGSGSSGGSGGGSSAPTPYSDRGTGLQFTGRKVGGLITEPRTLVGEDYIGEVVAPEQSFKDYSLSLMSQSLDNFRTYMANGELAIAGNRYSQYANTPASAPVFLNLGNDNVFAEGAEKQIYNMLQNYNRKN